MTIGILERDANRNAIDAIDRNMRVAWHELRLRGESFHLADGKLMAGEVTVNGDTAIVDTVSALVGGMATVFSGDTRVATSVRKDDGSRATGTKLARNAAYDSALVRGQPYRGVVDILGRPYITGYDPIRDANGQVIGVLFVGTPLADFFRASDSLKRWLTVAAGGVALLSFAAVLLLSRRMLARPLDALSAAMRSLAAGQLQLGIPFQKRRDEIGDMARALQVFHDNAVEMQALRREHDQAAETRAAERRRAMHEMAERFEATVMGVVESVSGSAAGMEQSARSAEAAADQASRQAASVSAVATEVTANVNTVAAAADELGASISEIARQVDHAAAISRTAAEATDATHQRVATLAATAERIGEVVHLINAIASQTNLLALNATIEAARAGEAGRGFAVVASEVKHLADQTAKATLDITAQIGSVQSETRQVVEVVERIGAVIGEVGQISAGIASAVEQQQAATLEIARNVQQAAGGTNDVARHIDGVTEASASTRAAANQVLGAAEGLARDGDRLRREIAGFLGEVRAG